VTDAAPEVLHLGRIAYAPALELQLRRRDAVLAGEAPEAVFTLEHDPVITLGRRARETDLLVDRDALRARGIDVVDVDRGGEVTWHGPGQLVVYAIIDCTRRGLGPSDLVRGLADCVRFVAAELGVESTYDTANPGLWVDGAKLAAFGMRISRGVSTHGAALNVTADTTAYSLIVPCGLPGARATSLAALGAATVPLDDVARRVAARFLAFLERHPASRPRSGVRE
jgi:lipoyl(octanoyl) transferase